jgi:hypothetical protein
MWTAACADFAGNGRATGLGVDTWTRSGTIETRNRSRIVPTCASRRTSNSCGRLDRAEIDAKVLGTGRMDAGLPGIEVRRKSLKSVWMSRSRA